MIFIDPIFREDWKRFRANLIDTLIFQQIAMSKKNQSCGYDISLQDLIYTIY